MSPKNLAKGLVGRLGYKIVKQPQVDADQMRRLNWLKAYPRYRPTEVMLQGRQFSIADALSFYHSYREIFIDEIYRFPCEKSQPIIVDCGANYGLSILYFKTLYADARVIGFEADPYIFEFLQQNVSTYQLQDVSIHNQAVWFEEGELNFQREFADAGRLTVEAKEDTVRVKSIDLSDYLSGEIDLLKVDIEGAEVEVLTHIENPANVRRIFVEYHSFQNRRQRLDELLSFFSRNGFRYHIQTQFGTRQPFVDGSLYQAMDMQLNIFARVNQIFPPPIRGNRL